MDIRSAQHWLKQRGYSLEADGIAGPATYKAVADAAVAYSISLPAGWLTSWPNARKTVAVKQVILLAMGIDAGPVDGFVGPQFDHAVSVWQDKMRDHVPTEAEVAHQPNVWPRQAQVPQFYGAVGTNQTMLECPYPMKLAWDLGTTINRFSVHEKVHDSAKRVLEAVLATYGIEAIKTLGLNIWGGSLNVRKMRGGSSYSMHSWGIAIDFDPDRNQLRWGKDKAEFAKPVYNKWWELWEAEGWVSLGRERDYDWMHCQAARL